MIDKYQFPFKEPGFLGDIRLANSRSEVGNMQNHLRMLCTWKQVNYQRLQTIAVKKKTKNKKANLRNLPLAKNGTVRIKKCNKRKMIKNIKYIKSCL